MAAPKLIDSTSEGPQRIDRYDLVAEIASGGMATVYLARLSGVGGFRRFVAIKRLHPHLAGEQEFVEMFLDEARLAAGIHHPNVVPILEVGASDRGYYLVMEYIEGDTLARLLARAASAGKRLPVEIGCRIVVDMLNGLHAAHELRDENGDPTGLVHRDVSPQNVLVGMDGNTRITDFGVARAASRLSATRAGQLKGKIAYMAPEQAVGDPTVDRRADVFSSGIVLWEVLAAKRLFKAENEAATLSRVISEEVPHICEVNPEIDPSVGEVVMTALNRDRDGRYPDCAEFADDLERASAAAGVLSPSRDVAGYVGGVIGDEITQQREAVRAWLARSEPSQVAPDIDGGSADGPPPLVAAGADQSGMIPSPLGETQSHPPSSNGIWVVTAAALAGFVGVGAAVALLSQRQEPQPAPATPQTVIVREQVPAPAPAPPAPAPSVAPSAEATDDGITVTDVTDDTAGAGGAAGEEEDSPTKAKQRTFVPSHRWKPRPAPAPTPKAAPKPEPAPASGGDIDLSNPYR